MLARVRKIMMQLVHAWDVLANSSDFQSAQHHCIEFALGKQNI
jgi:tryptophan 2,3-dioxygenase